MIDKIKNDKELEPYFMKYMKLNLAIRKQPKEIPNNADKETTTDFLKVTYDFNKSIEELFQQLHDKYNVSIEIEDDDSPVNKILIEVCEYYYNKYGEDKIITLG